MERSGSRDMRAYLGVGLGVATVSTAATLIRLALVDLDSLAVAAWRLTLAACILAPITLLTCREELRALERREWAYAGAAGVLLAATLRDSWLRETSPISKLAKVNSYDIATAW